MKTLQPTTQFKKDLKRYRHDFKKLSQLRQILFLLKTDQPIPAKYQPHILKGSYKGCLECHIQSDFLLIWIDETKGIIELVRLGSHADLFVK